MRFLITNDDGILAHGIECLTEAAEPLAEVFVVAPHREQSATSHSLTLHHPLRPGKRAERRAEIAGEPLDWVVIAAAALVYTLAGFLRCGITDGEHIGGDG